jgi:hypothetical protein
VFFTKSPAIARGLRFQNNSGLGIGRIFIYFVLQRNAHLKRIFSSVFIGLILLNVMGYYGVFLGLQYHHTRVLIRQFDAGAYDQTDALTVKIPFKTDSHLSSEVYERVDGDFERNGEVYRLIKQRHYRDTFHIVYIKDKTGTALQQALVDYVKTFAEAPADDGHETTALPLFIKEYIIRNFAVQAATAGWEQSIRKETHPFTFIDSFTSSVIHPPERA